MRWRELDHPTDLYIEVRRKTLRSIYASMAAALFERLREVSAAKPEVFVEIRTQGVDREDLLVRFLNKTISISQSEKLDPLRFRVEQLSRTSIRATAACGRIDAEHSPTEVKAATYHGLEIKRTASGEWRARVLFDL